MLGSSCGLLQTAMVNPVLSSQAQSDTWNGSFNIDLLSLQFSWVFDTLYFLTDVFFELIKAVGNLYIHVIPFPVPFGR